MPLSLPDLPYSHDALNSSTCRAKPWSFTTTSITWAYVTQRSTASIKGTEWEDKSLEEIVKGSHGKNAALFNNAAQHYNHTHFWKWMKPGGGGDKLPSELKKRIEKDLGGIAKAKKDFIDAGVSQFGSGWCWISVKDGKLEISKSPNGENPLIQGGKPILGCDVWEHSYYIDYRNRRADYLKAFWDDLINWDHVYEMFLAVENKATALSA